MFLAAGARACVCDASAVIGRAARVCVCAPARPLAIPTARPPPAHSEALTHTTTLPSVSTILLLHIY